MLFAIKTAGFIVDGEVDKRKDIMGRAEEISIETGVEIQLLSFDEWIGYEIQGMKRYQLDEIADKWLIAVVESFAQKRQEIAPVDEPCEAWISDLMEKLRQKA
ncbi:MAG: hypothetical protein OSJ53_04955 [Kineothrix sp.]|nr:hypothetical protein [Kineothrix sp.]